MPSGLGNNEIAYASFDRTELDRLSSQLITLQPAAGLWQVRLVQADGHSLTQVAEVDENGRFAYRAKALEGFSQLPAVQIVMKLGDREARGWVHNDMLLGMSARRRLTAGALNRLMRWDAIDDDIQALLDYLSIQAEQHLDSAAIPRSGPRRFAEVSQRDFRCCLAGIPCPTPSNGMHIAVDPARLAGDRQIEEAKVFQWLAILAQGRRTPSSTLSVVVSVFRVALMLPVRSSRRSCSANSYHFACMKRLSGSRNRTGIIGLSQAAPAAKGNILKTFNEQFGNIPWADGDRVHKLITEDIPEKVAADTAYQNAKQNAD